MTNRTHEKYQGSGSFEDTALPYLDNVYRAAVSLCSRAEQAEELTQITFLKALERFDTFKRGTNCKAWLFQILRNVWIDQLRHKKVVGNVLSVDEELVEDRPDVHETTWSNPEDLLDNFSDEQIIQAMRSLAPVRRLTLFLIDVEQLSQQEVAEITDVAVGTVKSRTSRARNELKDRLASYAQQIGFVEREE